MIRFDKSRRFKLILRKYGYAYKKGMIMIEKNNKYGKDGVGKSFVIIWYGEI